MEPEAIVEGGIVSPSRAQDVGGQLAVSRAGLDQVESPRWVNLIRIRFAVGLWRV